MERIVLAMASGGEPLRRMLLEVGERVFYLANPDRIGAVEAGETDPVGFPQEDVFEFNEDIFAALADQWARSGATDPATWQQLRRYPPPAS
jgi:hypothetical protein